MREFHRAGIERAADHARNRNLWLTERSRRDAPCGDGDRARGGTLGHASFIRHLLLLRILNGAELVLADGFLLEGFRGYDHVFQRLRD